MMMKQAVIVTRAADRHAGPGRDFASSHEVVVDEGPVSDVLRTVADHLDAFPVGRYSLSISEPFAAEGGEQS